MSRPIEDYALVGDTQTAALVGRDGSIDWLCLPAFGSPAVFAQLLGGPEHGFWALHPASRSGVETRRRYRGDTLILETEHTVGDAAALVIDFMPPRGREPDLVRIVRGVRGRVAMRSVVRARLDYGALRPWCETAVGAATMVAGPDALALRTPVELTVDGGDVLADFEVGPGQEIPFVLEWHPSYERPSDGVDPTEALASTEAWWTRWAQRCSYDGRWAEAVRRSLVTLKALTFAPTGGIVAAVTTSIPERLGGVRNWDYRYCWLRDATFTLNALLTNGYHEEAVAWRDWLVRAVAGDPSQMQIMYSVEGGRRLPELTLDWLPGYAGSAPVRVGNAAAQQFQLDVFGEVMDTLHDARRSGLEPDPVAWRVQRALLDHLESRWEEPDEGLWEIRGPRRHFTHSKLMAWVAFDRAVKAVETRGLDGPAERWRRLRDRMREEICTKGFDERIGAFTQAYATTALDASLLMIPLVGFLPATDPRVVGTVRAIEKELLRDGLVQRYVAAGEHVDGLPPGEGAFVACSFWLADNYVLMGRVEEARRLFERLLGLRNDVGLLAEEYDPHAGRLLGNFPQAFSHVGLVNTALNLGRSSMGPAVHRHDRAARGDGE